MSGRGIGSKKRHLERLVTKTSPVSELSRASFLQRWVKWFGDDTVSLVSEKSMKPLSEGLKRRMQRKTTKDLQKAISLALKAQRKKEKKVR